MTAPSPCYYVAKTDEIAPFPSGKPSPYLYCVTFGTPGVRTGTHVYANAHTFEEAERVADSLNQRFKWEKGYSPTPT